MRLVAMLFSALLVAFNTAAQEIQGRADAPAIAHARVEKMNEGGMTTQGTGQANTGIEGRVWRLTRLRGHDDIAALTRPPTLRFNAGQLQAFNGCNTLMGAYSVEGDRVTFGALAGTMMACPPPASAIEASFNKTLAGTLRVHVSANELTLTADPDSDPALVFVAGPPPAFEGIVWDVTALDNTLQGLASPIEGTVLTISFQDGSVSGRAGCNSFHGTYTHQQNQLKIGSLAATRKMCPANGVMDQERRFLAAVESVATWGIEPDMLVLRRADGTRVVRARRPLK